MLLVRRVNSVYVIRLFLAEGVCVTSANSTGQDTHFVHIVTVGFGRQTIWSTDISATASTDPNPNHANPNPNPNLTLLSPQRLSAK